MKQNKIPRNEYIIKPKGKIDPYKDDVYYGNSGQYTNPGQVTRIPGDGYGTSITMQGVNYPLHGIDDTGYSQMMYPGMDYTFPGKYVTEYPMQFPFGGIHTKTDTHMATGGWLDSYEPGGEKPWGDMTAKERAAYLDAKEANAKAENTSRKQATKEHYQDYVKDSMKKTLEHPMFNTAQYFTPEGMAIGAIKGLADVGPDVAKGDYSAAAFDALTALPAVAPAVKNILGLKAKNFKTQIADAFTITPETRALINSNDLNSSWDNYVVPEINSPSPWEGFLERQAEDAKLIRNRSGLTKKQALERFAGKDKETLSKMSEKDFQETVTKPTGEVVKYKQGPEVTQMGYNADLKDMQLKNAIPMSHEEYANAFNERLDLLNDIIAKNNKTGLEYKVKGLDPRGMLTFETPSMPAGNNQRKWHTVINPGQWRGEVEDIANTEYFKSIPGLNMSNTAFGVFGDAVPRRGTGTYESINEYLKGLDLGRVKPGFNSQTEFSQGLWENAIKKGNAVGFYKSPHLVHGVMKTALPYVGTGALGAAALQQEKFGGWLDEFAPGGEKIKISDKRTIRQTTGKAINPNKDLKTGSYDKAIIDSLAENATRRGVNPYQAIAMSLIESRLGKADSNVGHVSNFKPSVSPYKQMMDEVLKSQSVAKRLNKTDPAAIIQAYNGYGKLFPNTEKDYHGFKSASFYGVPVTEKGLNMKENPLYGKEVLDIQKNIIEKDPNIKNIVTSYQYPRIKGYAKDWNDFLPHVEVAPKELTEEDLNKENMKALLKSTGQLKKGGQKSLKKYTSKNIQSSVNDIMLRNETLFGPPGKKRYKANVKYKDGGNWLDNMY